MKRRTFLTLLGGVAGTGLVASVAYRNRHWVIGKVIRYVADKDFDAQAFVVVLPDGTAKVVCHRSEMCQGIRTALPMIVADELDLDWSRVEVVQADADPRFGSQNTDGSRSVRDFYQPLRLGAATLREMLVLAAATRWNVSAATCTTQDGEVIHEESQRRAGYEELIEFARTLPVPKQPRLKAAREFTLVGHAQTLVDATDIVHGTAIYGADVSVQGMLIAVLQRAPTLAARISSFDPKPALALRGVVDVVELEAHGPSINTVAAVAVVARDTWSAMRGRQALDVRWTEVPEKELTLDRRPELQRALQGKLTRFRNDGHVDRIAEDPRYETVEATYHTPYLVHASMEPPVALADVRVDGCEIWAPTQAPRRAHAAAARVLGLKEEQVTVHVTLLGGGFGRKGQPDFVVEAVLLSKRVGKPVRVQWTREDEIQHGFYHPEALQVLTARVNRDGIPVSWHHRVAVPTLASVFTRHEDTPTPAEMAMGFTDMPYRIPNVRCEAASIRDAIHVGWYRSVFHLFSSFAVNGFIDELAARVGRDPIDYPTAVLESLLERAGFDVTLEQLRGEGRSFVAPVSASGRRRAAR